MATFTTVGSSIAGISAAVPAVRIDNMEYELLTPSEQQLFVKTTGIRYRHVAGPGQTTGDLCYAAANQLLNKLNWRAEDIDLVIMVSQSPDYFLPATAIILQDRLGMKKSSVALDINLGCSGYVYGLSVISAMMQTGAFKKALLLAGDVSTAATNKKDKSTYPLFGDAGTATALEYNRDYEIAFDLNSDGSGQRAIYIPHGGIRHPIDATTFEEQTLEGGIIRHQRNLWLDGSEVFNFSVREAPTSIQTLLNFTGTSADEIDFLVLHQANKLMDETIRKKLKFPVEKVPYTLHDFGNTSSASIPLTIAQACRDRQALTTKWLISGFGVGLSWGSAQLTTHQLVLPEILYI